MTQRERQRDTEREREPTYGSWTIYAPAEDLSVKRDRTARFHKRQEKSPEFRLYARVRDRDRKLPFPNNARRFILTITFPPGWRRLCR